LVKCKTDESETNWWERGLTRADDLLGAVGLHGLDARLTDVYCEMPIFFGGTSGGVGAAETGALQKLSFLVGTYARTFDLAGAKFIPVLVTKWKGQLTKDVVCRRIEGMLGEVACKKFKADIWDAVGLGLHVKGVFK
jgi:hypothetical protein